MSTQASSPDDAVTITAPSDPRSPDLAGARETVRRAGAVMDGILADLPVTNPWSGRPAPAFRPLPPA